MVDITLVIERRQSFDYYVFTRFDIIPLRRYHVAYIKDGFSRSNKSVRRASKAPSLPLSSLVFQWVYFFSALVCLWWNSHYTQCCLGFCSKVVLTTKDRQAMYLKSGSQRDQCHFRILVALLHRHSQDIRQSCWCLEERTNEV